MSGDTRNSNDVIPENARFHWAEGLKYVSEGFKSLFLLNGAATVSILTFIGNEDTSDKRFVYSLFCFAFAALLGPIQFVLAYLTQLQYGNSQYPAAWRYHNATYAALITSMLLFVAGVLFAGCAFLEFSPDNLRNSLINE